MEPSGRFSLALECHCCKFLDPDPFPSHPFLPELAFSTTHSAIMYPAARLKAVEPTGHGQTPPHKPLLFFLDCFISGMCCSTRKLTSKERTVSSLNGETGCPHTEG